MGYRKKYLIAFLLIFTISSLYSQSITFKVGAYENYPLVYTGEEGSLQGFTIKVLDHIARLEGWELEYRMMSWPECLAALEKGEIDFQVGIGRTEERDEIYDFTSETVFTVWGQVYSRPGGLLLESILDIEGKVVALYKGSILSTRFKELVSSFDISCEFLELEDYHAMIDAMNNNQADAGVFNRTFGEDTPDFHKLVRTPIVFNPIGVRYAVPEGKHEWAVQIIDKYLYDFKREKESRYYRLLNEMLGTVPEEAIPIWIIWVIAGIGGLLLISFVIIALFRHQIDLATREIREKNTSLKSSLREKELLLKEVHHRVKNNLNTISSLLNLQTYYTDNKELITQYREIIGRVKSIGIIHDRLYQTEDFSSIKFCEYIDQLVSELERIFNVDSGRIKIYHHCGGVSFDIETAIPVGLIINELITNAVKYAFPDSREGEIRIFFTDQENGLGLVVQDNGVGMPGEIGLDKKHGLGLQLVKALITQINGSIEVKNNGGVMYTIRFGEQQ